MFGKSVLGFTAQAPVPQSIGLAPKKLHMRLGVTFFLSLVRISELYCFSPEQNPTRDLCNQCCCTPFVMSELTFQALFKGRVTRNLKELNLTGPHRDHSFTKTPFCRPLLLQLSGPVCCPKWRFEHCGPPHPVGTLSTLFLHKTAQAP